MDAAASAPGDTLRGQVRRARARWRACPVRYALLGLGKLGGVALGYASDIELLLVYSDSGSTGGPERIDNAEFFDKLVREVLQLVHAKREGIFHIDLRLRPYGAAGPAGVQPGELLHVLRAGRPGALLRAAVPGAAAGRGRGQEPRRPGGAPARRDGLLRAEHRPGGAAGAAGPPGAGKDQVEPAPISLPRRFRGPAGAGSSNAKFSPGALVDLEYAVQILQVMHGATEQRLRTPRIHEALRHPGLHRGGGADAKRGSSWPPTASSAA